MQKKYSKSSRVEGVTKKLSPKEDTIKFLLDYSKALSVIHIQDEKFEAFLN